MFRCTSAIIGSFAFAFAISAQANLITNGSFEDPVITANSYQYGTPTSWNWSNAQGFIFNGNVGSSGCIGFSGISCVWPLPEDGQQYVNIGDDPDFTLFQDFTVTIGGSYQLTWYDNSVFPDGAPSLYSVEVLDSSNTSVGNANFDAYHGGNWVGRTLLLNLPPDTYRLSFTAQGIFGDFDSLLDNVSVASSTAQVPEPATFALMSVGLAGMCFGKRRKLA